MPPPSEKLESMISREGNLGVLLLMKAAIRVFVKIDLVVAQLAQNLAEGSDRRPGSHSDPGLSGAFVLRKDRRRAVRLAAARARENGVQLQA